MNGWTGGQYSLARAMTGAVMALWSLDFLAGIRAFTDAQFGVLPPVTSAHVLASSLVGWLSVPVALLFAAGVRDRWCGVLLLLNVALQATWSGRWGLVPGGLVVAHLMAPPAPFLSWDARRDAAPGLGWSLPDRAWGLLWRVAGLDGVRCAAGTWLSYDRTTTGLWLAGAYLAATLAGQRREWRMHAWLAVAVLAVVSPAGRFADGAPLAYVPFLFLLFDPDWIPERPLSGSILFYDGWCGLCHGAVRFLLAEDVRGVLRFSPQQGNTMSRRIDAATRLRLPDSVVLLTDGGQIYVRSAAILVAAEGLGGWWRLGAVLAGCLPRALLDALYDSIARVRGRLFVAPRETCPVLPPEWRRRILN